MRRAKPEDLLFVSKSPKERLDILAAGASLVGRTGYDIKELRKKAALDRLTLAASFLNDAKTVSSTSLAMKRTAVSRAYYAMYHAIRAATFISYGGDDHEQHTILPSRIPSDFPDAASWQNKLKNARLERNRADYDPYPKRDGDFADIADMLVESASQVLALARGYVKAKSS